MSTRKEIFKLPTNDFASELKQIIAPNFFWTNASVYDCLVDLYAFLDARPIFESDGITLGVHYFNDFGSDNVKQEELTAYKSQIKNDKYANGFLTNYQNARIDHSMIFPSEYNFARVKTSEAGVPDKEDYRIFANEPIDYINHLYLDLENMTIDMVFLGEMYADGVAQGETYLDTKQFSSVELSNDIKIDFSTIIIEDSVYASLDRPRDIKNAVSLSDNQYNTMHYSQGSKEISYALSGKVWTIFDYENLNLIFNRVFCMQLGGHFYENTTPIYFIPNDDYHYYDLRYKIDFMPQVSGITKVESPKNKDLGELRISQANGGALLSKLGRNSLGQIIRSGNAERTITRKVSKFNDRYKVGDYILDSGKKRIINKETTTIYKDFCFQTLELIEDFNKISEFIRIDNQKRFSEISKSLVAKSEDFYTEYLYISLDLPTKSEEIHLNFNYVKNELYNTILGVDLDKNLDLDFIAIRGMNAKGDYYLNGEWRYIPFYKYGSGNTINFEMSYDNSINAGTRLNESTELWQGSYYFVEYCLYADTFGFMDYVDIAFEHSSTLTREQNDYLPKVLDTTISQMKQVGSFSKMKFNKRPNEIFALNYQLCVLGENENEIFIGDYFIKNNSFIKHLERNMYVYCSTSEIYSILDLKAKGNLLGKISALIDTTYSFTISDLKPASDIVSWCIADSDKNIYFAFNQEVASGEKLKFYFYTKQNRNENGGSVPTEKQIPTPTISLSVSKDTLPQIPTPTISLAITKKHKEINYGDIQSTINNS